MSQSLAVKYRPQVLEEIVGQSTTVKILKRSVQSRNFKNAYLFIGSSGTGKTTCARAFADRINGGVGHPIEVDAASNNGVDNVRAIIESANQRSVDSEYKVYIIDEAHMLTMAAWNALLKTIEEPPQYTLFIFCTTEPNKIPATIMNRVQRYNFSKIDNNAIYDRLCYICDAEGFTNYQSACDFIAKASNGSLRSAITYLEQCACLSTNITIDVAKSVLGELSFERMVKLTNFIKDGDIGCVLYAMDASAMEGIDLRAFIDHYLTFVIDLAKYSIFTDLQYTNIPSYLAVVQDESINVKLLIQKEGMTAWLNGLTDLLLELKSVIKNDVNYKATIQGYLMRACRGFN